MVHTKYVFVGVNKTKGVIRRTRIVKFHVVVAPIYYVYGKICCLFLIFNFPNGTFYVEKDIDILFVDEFSIRLSARIFVL